MSPPIRGFIESTLLDWEGKVAAVVFLPGCNFRCGYCHARHLVEPMPSDEFIPLEAILLNFRRQRGWLDGVVISGGEPTIHLPTVLEIVAALPDDAKLVWKTNAHGSAQARELLDGMFDVWLADFKFGNDACAQRLAKVSDYVRVVEENLLWASEHSELIVRHLLMPGHVECCWQPVAEWLAAELPGVKVNLRTGFWPAWQAARHPELRGTVSTPESARAVDLAQRLGLNLVP